MLKLQYGKLAIFRQANFLFPDVCESEVNSTTVAIYVNPIGNFIQPLFNVKILTQQEVAFV
ncbi:hypothetical protein [Scytonema sp. NUACC26]|uniref:hypothetical protein n=1 Tax=Scytonema sp. NUACC26 TaxID=3140176 RepID=UPI0034DC50F5